MRPLFSSIHCYLDPSSGAALCTRELLELLSARGMDCRVLTTGILDPERETSLDEVLAALELPDRWFQAALVRGGSAEAIDLRIYGVRVMLMPAPNGRPVVAVVCVEFSMTHLPVRTDAAGVSSRRTLHDSGTREFWRLVCVPLRYISLQIARFRCARQDQPKKKIFGFFHLTLLAGTVITWPTVMIRIGSPSIKQQGIPNAR